LRRSRGLSGGFFPPKTPTVLSFLFSFSLYASTHHEDRRVVGRADAPAGEDRVDVVCFRYFDFFSAEIEVGVRVDGDERKPTS
jgi:hypothetical protein